MTVARLTLVCGLAATVLVGVALLSLSPYRYLGVGATATAPAAKPRAVRPPPLLGADGTPQPAVPQAVPTDPLERTRAALYATRAQAQALEGDLNGAVIRVDAGCCDNRAVGFAVDLTDGLRSGRHLALDVPVFVSGVNLRLAALVADRLTDDGYTQVFLVTR